MFEPLLFSSNSVEDHVKNSKITGTWAETVDIFSCASLLERPICTFSSSQKKWCNFEPIMKTDSFSSLTKKKCQCPITSMYHDEYAQANHFNLLLPRGGCCSAPLPENTASSVSIDLENSGNSNAKAVKQMSQTHPSFKPHLIKATESKQLGQDLTSLNTKTSPSYSKTTVKRPTQSPEATTAKQTTSVKQLNPATCTKPSTMTSSQTPTDKTSCTTTKQPPSKQAIATSTDSNFDQMDVKNIKAFISARGVQVSTYCKTELIHRAKAIAFMDLPTDPDFENESIDECLSRRLKLPAGQKILDPFLPNGIIVQ